MSDMFKNYPQPSDYTPNNRRIPIPKDIITIMSGETTTHSFEVPLDYEKDIVDYRAIYKLGLEVVLEKTMEECAPVYDKNRMMSILTWKLSPSETMLFRNTLLDAKVQLRFSLIDGSIAFSDIMDIKLEDSLQSAIPPSPQVVDIGYGWTED